MQTDELIEQIENQRIIIEEQRRLIRMLKDEIERLKEYIDAEQSS